MEVLDEGARPWWPLLVFPPPSTCYPPRDNTFVHSNDAQHADEGGDGGGCGGNDIDCSGGV